jgi:hypothetical protein
MNSITKCGITLFLAAGLSSAADWNAKLLDANCSALSPTAISVHKKASEKLVKTCAPSASTTSFAIIADGKIYKLDIPSDAKAEAAMKDGSVKADPDGDVQAAVSGTIQGDRFKVDSITGKGEHK